MANFTNIYDILNKLIEECIIVLIKGDDDVFYIKYILDNVPHVENIRSEMAQAFLREKCRELSDDELIEFDLDDLRPFLDKVMLYDSPEVIHGRLCQNEDSIEYALHDDKGRIIKMSDSGKLTVANDSDNIFVKKSYMLPQPMPKKTDESLYNLLYPFVNLGREDYILLLCLLVTMLIPDISHYAIFVSAEFGSGKSTLCRLISELIDHSFGGVSVMPSRVEDIKTTMSVHYICSFDNVQEKNIRDVNDLICSSITGANYVKRKLYSDLDEVNVKLHNVCLINGIRILDQNKDILSRSVGLNPLKITDENRMTDSEFWGLFHRQKPMIMYRLFKTVAKVLKLRGTVDIVSRERMADAYQFVVLSGIALGFEQQYIEDILYNNRKALSALAYQSENGLISLVANYVENIKGNSITGSVTAVYKYICRRYNPEDFGIEKFPANASAFSRKLSELQAELLEAGVAFVKTTRKNFTEITLCNKHSSSKRAIKLVNDKPYSRPIHKSDVALTDDDLESEDSEEYDTDVDVDATDDVTYDYPDEGNQDEYEAYNNYYEE